jgi:hypothetical protein
VVVLVVVVVKIINIFFLISSVVGRKTDLSRAPVCFSSQKENRIAMKNFGTLKNVIFLPTVFIGSYWASLPHPSHGNK